MSGKLYVVGTPIGNLGDATERMVETLKSVDFIAAEDTRVTLKLLNHFEIKKPMVSYFEHNIRQRGEEIINRILSGENCAVVSDAGMPLISDPGEDLVRLAYENGIETTVVPGPTAFSCALVLSGLTVKRFSFEGFLSMNKNSRSEHLSSLKNEERTMVFYEAPHKLKSTLKDLQSAFSDGRRISIVKEITKLHESVFRGTIGEAVAYFEENEPRGEYVLVVDGKTQEKREYTLEEAVEEAKKLVSEGISKTDASKTAAKLYGFKKSDIYKELN